MLPLGQDRYDPAVPPGLARRPRPLSAYFHMPALLTECHLRLPYSAQAFQCALRGPFTPSRPAASQQPAALWKDCQRYYLLPLIDLIVLYTKPPRLSTLFPIFHIAHDSRNAPIETTQCSCQTEICRGSRGYDLSAPCGGTSPGRGGKRVTAYARQPRLPFQGSWHSRRL